MKKIATYTSIAGSYLLLASNAFATGGTTTQVSLCPNDAKFNSLCTQSSQLGEVIGRVIVIALVAAAVIALFFLIWGGIKWILSGGDKSKVEAARNTIIAAVIGLIITFLAFFILSFVFQLFGLGAITDLNFSTFRILG